MIEIQSSLENISKDCKRKPKLRLKFQTLWILLVVITTFLLTPFSLHFASVRFSDLYFKSSTQLLCFEYMCSVDKIQESIHELVVLSVNSQELIVSRKELFDILLKVKILYQKIQKLTSLVNRTFRFSISLLFAYFSWIYVIHCYYFMVKWLELSNIIEETNGAFILMGK